MRQRYLPRSTEESHFRPIADIPALRETGRGDSEGASEVKAADTLRSGRELSPETLRAMSYHEKLYACGRVSPLTLCRSTTSTPSPDSLLEHRLVTSGSAFHRPSPPTFISFGHQVRETLSPPPELVESYRSGLPVRAPLRITTNKASETVRVNHQSSPNRVRNYHGTVRFASCKLWPEMTLLDPTALDHIMYNVESAPRRHLVSDPPR